MSTDKDFARIVSSASQPTAHDNVLNACAGVLWMIAALLVLASPAIAWQIWTWAW